MKSEKLRHFCRHCRSKLKAPVANHREAFCVRGCHGSFYRHRCVVCERDMPRNAENQRTCYRADCKTKWQQKLVISHFLGAGSTPAKGPHGGSIKSGLPEADKVSRWVQIAGPPLTPSQLHCATVPDGPGCQSKGGAFERIEAENRKLLDEHFARLNAMATDQCATCGTGEDLVDHKPDLTRPEHAVTLCRSCRDKRAVAPFIGAGAALIATIPDDLSIPVFLQR